MSIVLEVISRYWSKFSLILLAFRYVMLKTDNLWASSEVKSTELKFFID